MSGDARDGGEQGGHFDPIAEGARYQLSPEVSSAIWEHVSGAAAGSRGRSDGARAKQRFHELASRAAASGGAPGSSPGKESLVEATAQNRSPRPAGGQLAPGKQTLVETEAQRQAGSAGSDAAPLSLDAAFDALMASLGVPLGRRGPGQPAGGNGRGDAPAAGEGTHAPKTGDSGGRRESSARGDGGRPPDLGNYDSETGRHVVVLREWDDKTIAARRVEMQGLLSRTLDIKARDKLLREYEAIEWVARERNLALPKDPGEEAAPQAHMGGKPIKFTVPDSAQGMRAMLEREMAAGTGYADAKDHASTRIGYSTTSGSATDRDKRVIGAQQTELMDHDAASFRAAFQAEAKHTALTMLDSSSAAIDKVLQSYGIAGGTVRLSDAARKVAANPGTLDAEVETWVALSQRLDGNHAALAAGHSNREDLAKEAAHLRDLQSNIAELASEQQRLIQIEQARHPQHPGMKAPPKQPNLSKLQSMAGPSSGPSAAKNPFDRLPAPTAMPPAQRLASVQSALQLRQGEFRAAWINAERAHPVLAAYRAGKAPDAATLSGIGSDEATMRSVIKQVLPKLGNIIRTKAAVMGAWGTLDPLQLAPVVELTKQRMFVAEGSYRDRAVHDMAEHAHEKDGGIAHWAFQAVMLGLTVLTLVPTGGASGMAALALTGLAYDIYAGLGEYEDFKLASAAGDTDLDQMRSISDDEPSLTPLLTRMVSAGVNLTIAAGLFKRAAALRRMAATNAAERDAIAALNRAGEQFGVAGVGDEATAVSNPGSGLAKPQQPGLPEPSPGAHDRPVNGLEKAAAERSAGKNEGSQSLRGEHTSPTQTPHTETSYQFVEITDVNGVPVGEFDVVIHDGVATDRFIEDKSAQGLKHPRNKQTPAEWAQRQIFEKTAIRIKNLEEAVIARPRPDGLGSSSVPTLDQLRTIHEFEFVIESADTEVQAAVGTQLARLRSRFPSFRFNARFGK